MKKLSGRFILAAAFVMVVALVFACTKKETGSIKLGVAGAHSGDLASYGLPTVKAAEFVVKDINAKGGILGRKVELLVEDDVCYRLLQVSNTPL